jgi:hypothetical protein
MQNSQNVKNIEEISQLYFNKLGYKNQQIILSNDCWLNQTTSKTKQALCKHKNETNFRLKTKIEQYKQQLFL